MDQPEFRNAVVALDVPAGADPATGASALLVALKGLERAFGRQERERWGPREVDLDLLVFGAPGGRGAAGRPAGAIDPAKAGAAAAVPHARGAAPAVRAGAALRPGARAGAAGLGRDGRDARRRASDLEGPDAARPIATWDGEGWRPLA